MVGYPRWAVRVAFFIFLAASARPVAAAATYHVDPAGDDDHAGTSPEKPWKTLERASRQTLAPGDRLLFKAGGKWRGSLRPQGSGADKQPIVIDRYGEGPLPIIELGDQPGPAIGLANQDWIEIYRLELTPDTNPSDKPKRRPPQQGVLVEGRAGGKLMRHIYVQECSIHGFRGELGYNAGGIVLVVPGWPAAFADKVGFDDIFLANNTIVDIDRCGILIWTPAGQGFERLLTERKSPLKWNQLLATTFVLIKGNTLEDIGGEGILLLGCTKPVVERNTVTRCALEVGQPGASAPRGASPAASAITLHSCTDATVQHNVVAETARGRLNATGCAFACDLNCANTLIQYNLGRGNEGGFVHLGASGKANVVRYNISENNLHEVVQTAGRAADGHLVYNNVFYLDRGKAMVYDRANFANNIFAAVGDARFKAPPREEGQFRNNCFFGPWEGRLPNDPNKVTAAPMFVGPPARTGGLDALKTYQLLPASPCRNAGLALPNNGGKDFFGGVVNDGKPDIGVHELPPPKG